MFTYVLSMGYIHAGIAYFSILACSYITWAEIVCNDNTNYTNSSVKSSIRWKDNSALRISNVEKGSKESIITTVISVGASLKGELSVRLYAL